MTQEPDIHFQGILDWFEVQQTGEIASSKARLAATN